MLPLVRPQMSRVLPPFRDAMAKRVADGCFPGAVLSRNTRRATPPCASGAFLMPIDSSTKSQQYFPRGCTGVLSVPWRMASCLAVNTNCPGSEDVVTRASDSPRLRVPNSNSQKLCLHLRQSCVPRNDNNTPTGGSSQPSLDTDFSLRPHRELDCRYPDL